MDTLSKKLGLGLIVLAAVVVLMMIGFYFGIRWASQDRSVLVGVPDHPPVPLSRLELNKKENVVISRVITGIAT